MQDLLSEYHFNLTPYNYCQNNPINYIDPFGLDTLKVDPNTGIPDGGELDGVTCVGHRPEKPVERGFILEGDDGKDYPGSNGRGPRIDMDILQWVMDLFKGVKYEKPGKKDIEETVKDATERAAEAFSDEEIVKKTAGNNTELIDKEVEKRSGIIEKDNKPQGEESDSTIRKYTIYYDAEDGNINRDKKIHKQTGDGRWISKPYKTK